MSSLTFKRPPIRLVKDELMRDKILRPIVEELLRRQEVLDLAEESGGGAPTSSSYVVIGMDATLTAERVLTGSSRISVTDNGANDTVVLDAIGAALTKTDDTNVTLTLGGSHATALVNAASLTLGWTGQLAVSRGGSGAATLTGVLIGNGTSAFTATTSSTVGQVLRVTGANTYAFGAVDLDDTDAVTGTLGVANGGTNLASGTDGGILGFTATGTLASSGLLAANGVVYGGGAGATPAATAAGTTSQVLIGGTPPSFGNVPAAALDQDLQEIAALANVQGDLLFTNATPAWDRLPKDTNASRYLSNTGASNAPAWAQVNLADGVTGDLPYANLTPSANASRVLGRTSASAGDWQEITPGTGITMSTTNLVVDQAFTPTWTGDHIFTSGIQIDTGEEITPSYPLEIITNTGSGGNDVWFVRVTDEGTSFITRLKANAGAVGDCDIQMPGLSGTLAIATGTMSSGRVALTQSGGGLTTDNDITFAGDTLTVTKIVVGSGATIAKLDFGTYNPTLTGVTNVTGSTTYNAQYTRVGTVVTVSGKLDVDPTAAGATELGISLPISSNIGNEYECCGTAAAIATTPASAAGIRGDATNNRAAMLWVTADTSNHTFYYTFTYQVI